VKYNKKISLIIPTLNEEKNLALLLDQIPSFIDEIIIIDGHSKDNTVQIAKKFGCQIIFDNSGKGSAIVQGVDHCTGEYIIMMDADCSHRISELGILVEGLHAGYDFCMGSRFIQGGGSDDITLLRKLGNKFFVLLVNLFWGTSYSDLNYGYRSFKRDQFQKLELTSRGFAIETEISIKSAKKKFKILEVPSFEKKRKHGEGKLKTFSDGWKVAKIIIKELFKS
jgi:glycosyltransferase involved in cell wall biosynthesis